MSSLRDLKVAEIKSWAKSNGIKIPSGLKKDDIILYVEGILYEKSIGIKRNKLQAIPIENINPVYCDTIPWLAHLHLHGWSVVPIPNWNSEFVDMFLQWFELCSPNFDKNNKETWIPENMPVMKNGVLKNYFGHTELQWRVRELCLPLFSELWQTKELLCSFDGGCLLLPSNERKFKNWIHHDSPKGTDGFVSVQGIVNFVDNGPNDGGLLLVEGSKDVFNEYTSRHPSEGIAWGLCDYSDPLISNRRLIKICAPPGCLILFDSRMFHCNVPPVDNNYRMCTYVSMQPRSGATEKELQKRVKLYEKGRLTGHWCYGPWFKETPENPNTYGKGNLKPSTIEIASLNDNRKSMIGY
jgi:hypothetical protein